MEDKQDNITGVGATGNPTQNIGGPTGSPVFGVPQVTQPKPLSPRSVFRMRGSVKLWVSIAVAFLLLTLGAAAYVVTGKSKTDNAAKSSLLDQTDKYDSQKIDLGNISALDSINLSTSQSLSVNGQLRANNSLVLAPIARPTQGTAGQLYYDQTLNNLAYHNGSGFVSLAGDEDIADLRTQILTVQASIPTVPAIPTVPSDIATFSGQNIFQALNTFNSGINASNLEVTGNTTLQGGLSVSGNTALGATTMSSLLLTTSLGVGSGGTGANSLANNGVLLGQGANPIASVTASGPNLCLMSTAGAPAFAVCPGGGGSGVDLLNGLAGTLTIANASGSGAIITIDNATSAAKGIASFNATNFSVASGAVNTIQDISVTSSPSFNALSLTTALSVANGGTGVNNLPNNGVIIGQGAGSLTGVTAGGTGLCLISNAGAPSFQTCPGSGGVPSVNGLTGALTINNSTGSGTAITIDDASTIAKGIASFNATNFLVSGGAVNVVQNINTTATPTFAGLTANGSINGQTISNAANFTGSLAVVGALNANTITPTGAMTVGSTSQSLTLQGNATTSLRATSAGITNSLVFTTPAGSNKNITLPNASGTVAVSASGPLALDANGNISCPTCATTGGPAAVDSLNGLTGALILANATGAGLTVTINDASTASKGIASFNSTNFTASSGAINTVQNINTTATPTFAGLTANGAINGQTISSAANFTGSVAIAGSLNANTITPTGAMTIGATGQSLTLQGNASTTLSATNGANTTSLAFQSPTANVTYRLQAAAAGTYDVCTTFGNCSGVGGGVTTPGGTVGAIAKFSAAQTLVDSLLSESGSVVTVGGSLAVNTITPTSAMTIGSTSQDLILQGDDSTRLSATLGGITNSLLFSAPSGSNKTITLPNASGTVAVSASGPIGIDANGNISCPTCTTSGGGGGGAVDSLNGLNGTLTVANASGAGSVITIDNASTAAKGIASFNSTNFSVSSGAVNTIQDISVSSSPTFNALTLSTALSVGNGGTGATSAGGARTNLGAAASGANGDITSLSGLTTALSIGQGGTGATTSQAALNNISQLTTNGDLLYHNGTNSTRLARGVNGECLTSNATTVLWGACGITAEADTLASVTGRGATTATAVFLQGGATVRGMTIDTATATDDKIALSVTTGGAASFTGTLTVADLTAARTWTLSDESGTICLQNSTSCGFALTSGSTAYIQNQNASQQATSNFWMSGTGRADTALQAPVFDTATAATLTLGGNATSISVVDDTVLVAGKSLTVTGGVTGTRPASPTEGMIYFDTTTKQLLTYANGKWQADRSSSTVIVGTSAVGGTSSAVASKGSEGADFVNASTISAQTVINAAIATLPATGGSVYLMEGTYIVDGSISLPNNVTLTGAGNNSVIKLKNAHNIGINMIVNTDTTTGTGINIHNVRIDGNRANNSSGTQNGLYFTNMGGGSGLSARVGAKISNVTVQNIRTDGIYFTASNNNILTNNTSLNNTSGIRFETGSSYNSLTGNISQGNIYGIYFLSASSTNTISGNTTQGNTIGIYLSSANNNTVSGNTIQGSGNGIYLDNANTNTISGNTMQANSSYGVTLNNVSNNNIINGNKLHDNGGTTANNAIHFNSSDSNTIVGNSITDTSASSTNYAIDVAAGSDTNYLADNTLGTGSINNVGTGTIFGGQVNSSGNYVVQPAGTIELMKNTNVTGALAVTGNATVSGGTLTVGTAAVAGSVVVHDGSSNTATIQVGNLTGNYVYTIPVTTANDSFCLQTLANCSGGAVSGIGALDGGTPSADGASISGSTLHLQSASSSFAGLVNTTTQTFAGNKTFVGDLSVQNVSLAANMSITITGGATGTRPGSPTEGMIYYDTTTDQLLTYANGKWQADRSSSTKIVGTSAVGGTSGAVASAAPDGADYINTSDTSAQTVINSAITALPAGGGTVYLMEGTYIVDGAITVPSNVTIVGAGVSTVLKLKNAINAGINLINANGGSNKVISLLKLDGNSANNSSGTQRAIDYGSAGSSTAVGVVMDKLDVQNFRSEAIYGVGGSHSKVTNSYIAANSNEGVHSNGIDSIEISGNIFRAQTSNSISSYGSRARITNNKVVGGTGILATTESLVANNTVQNSTSDGIRISGNNVTVTGNVLSSNAATGIKMNSSSSNSTISGNTVSDSGQHGISIGLFNINMIISNNIINNSGTVTASSSGIAIDSNTSNNSIIGNRITDTAGTGFAISLSGPSNINSYLSGNTYSGTGASSISDAGTGTIFGGQVDSSTNYVIQPAGTVELMKNTNVTGALAVTGNATVSGGTLTVGTAAVGGSVVINDGSSHTATIQVGNLAGNYIYTIPVTTASDSFCLQTLANCSGGGASTVGALDGGTANADGATISGTTIYLQSASNSFAGLVNTTTQTFAGDKTFVGDLSVQNVSVAANKSITITGGATGTRPGSPTEGMVYYDTTTDQLLTYANGKWQADRSANTKIVAASNSTQANKDAADYVADGTGDEVEINAALTAATGGKVYLMEGTYTAAATILVPNDTVLSGAGRGTLIQLADIDVTDNLIENASAQPRVTIRDLRIDGQKTLNTAGTQHGIYLNGGSGTVGSVVENVEVMNFRTSGVYSRIAYTSITNVTSESNTDKGFLLDTGTHQELEGVTARSNGQQGIWIDSGADLTTVTDSKFISNSDRGVRIIAAGVKFTNNTVTGQTSQTGIEVGTDRTTVTGNTVTGNQNGIVVTGNNNTITDNNVSSNTANAITVGSSTNTTVSSNYIGSNSGIGISVGNIVGVTITSNTINSNASYGIQLDLTDQALIANNYISNNGGAGGSSAIRIYSGCCGAPDENRIIDNVISDTAGSGFAILISNGSRNYLSGNTYSGTGATSISDSGTGTIYANQLDANGHLINRGTAAMSVNTATVTSSLTLQGGLTNTQLPVPALPVIARVGTAGTTTYGYKVTALDGTGETLPSTEGTIATANATLTGANYNTITWVSIPGAVQYKIYRTTSGGTPASTGLIGTVTGSATSVFNDTGIAATTAAPAANTTGGATIAGLIQGTSATLSGALTVQTSTATDDQLLVSITGGGAVRFTGTVTSADLTANRVWTLPDESGTICIQNSASCGFLVGSASSFIQNQNAGQQATSNFWMSGTGRADTALQAPVFDTATATALTLGGTATSINVLDNVTLAAGTSLAVTGGVTGTRPGSPTEGMIYYDTTTKQLLTYANGKWQADRSSSTVIVAANNSKNKDAADFAVSSADETAGNADAAITAAIAALPAGGGSVYLMEGTYTIDTGIALPSNVTFSGAGRGMTIIKLKNGHNVDINVLDMSLNANKTNITIQDLRIEGNKTNQTAGVQTGIYAYKVGTGSGTTATTGVTIRSVEVRDFRTNGVRTNTTQNSTIEDVNTRNNTGVGLFIDSSTRYTTINNVEAAGNTSYGIEVDSADYITVSDSKMIQNSSDGLHVDGSGGSYNSFTGNTITTNTGRGAYIRYGYATTFTENKVVSNTTDGVFLTSGISTSYAGIVFNGNTIGSNGDNGIEADRHLLDASISGNRVFGNTSYGINLNGYLANDNPEDNAIVGNYVYSNAGGGIRLDQVVDNTIQANTIADNGGATSNNAIRLEGSSSLNNNIGNNVVTDVSCTTTCYAIYIASAVNTYLSDNTLGGGTIFDTGSSTRYANQVDVNGSLINRVASAIGLNTSTVTSSLTLQGGMTNSQLPTPAQPTVARVGTAGTTTYGYKVTALDGTGETLPSTEGTIATANATLTGANYNAITWVAIPGAVQYKIYRTTSGGTPASLGLIGTVTGSAAVVFNDTGIAATTAAPGANTTGGITVAGTIQGTSATLSGALTANGALTVNNTALFKNASNSTTAFMIQDSSSTALLTADTTNTKIIVRTLEVTLNLTVNGHIISGGTTPTIAAGTAACTTPTVTMAGTDTAGTITVTTGTGCSPTGKLATITFATAYGAAPRVVLTSATSLTAGLNTYIDDSTISTTAFDLGTNTTPADSTTYKWYYQVIQ